MVAKIIEGSRRPDPRSRKTVPAFYLVDSLQAISHHPTREAAEVALHEYRQRNRRGPREHPSGAFDRLIEEGR